MVRFLAIFAVIVMVGAGSSMAVAQPQDFMRIESMTEEELAAKRAWVAEVEEQDFFFWRRYFGYQLRNPFTPPAPWYTPFTLVEGGLKPFFEETDDPGPIDPAAITAASDYAFAGPSTAFYIFQGGKIRHARFAEGFHHTRVIGSRSFSKTLAGLLMGHAVADGAITDLDAPIETWITEWAGEDRGRITVRQLLHNASGLEIDSPTIDPNNRIVRLVEGSDVTSVVLSYELAREPGSYFAHENSNTQLLAMIIERATGREYADYLSEKLWRPVGAQTGGIRLDKIDDGQERAFCCVRASPSDWLRIGVALMQGGVTDDGTRILPEGWLEQMLTGSKVNPNYGLHLWIGQPYVEDRRYITDLPGNYHSEPFLAEDLFFMDGGAQMRMWIVPSAELVVFRYGFPMKDFDEAFIPNTILRGMGIGTE